MMYAFIPKYKEIFGDEPPQSPIELLEGIASELVIKLLCKINSELIFREDYSSVQKSLFRMFMSRQPQKISRNIDKNIAIFLRDNLKGKKGELTFFSVKASLIFIDHEISNYRKLDVVHDTTPEQELKILKAYLFFGDSMINDYDRKAIKNAESKKLLFHEHFWPILINQYEFSKGENPQYQLFRALDLYFFLKEDKKCKSLFKNFEKKLGGRDIGHYAFDLSNVILSAVNTNGFVIKLDDGYSYIVDNLTIFEKDVLGITPSDSYHSNIIHKPLFSDEKGVYFLFNWNLLVAKLFSGFVFDFYNNSDAESIFKSFPNFKTYLGKKLSEENFFRQLIEVLVKDDRVFKVYDEGDSYVDCYIRVGKYVFLFEFKDNIVSSNVKSSIDFNTIKKNIDLRFISNEKSKRKGVKQLLNHIAMLDSNMFQEDSYEEGKIKKRNLIFYPIIVFTDLMYTMPGIEDYLNGKLDDLITTSSFNHVSKKNIRPLTMVSTSKFFEFLDSGEVRNIKRIKELIDGHHNKVKRSFKRYKKGKASNDSAVSYHLLGFDEGVDFIERDKEAQNDSKWYLESETIQQLFEHDST